MPSLPPEAPKLVVIANDVEVGHLSVAELHAIRTATRRDWRTYGSQLLNGLTVTLNVVNRLFRDVPFVWFWVMAALAFFQPASFLAMVATVLSHPENVIQAFTKSVQLSLFIAAIAVPAEAVISGQHLGFVDFFSVGVNRRIRQQLKLPVECTLVLVHPRYAQKKKATENSGFE